jgi:hypothetical protein
VSTTSEQTQAEEIKSQQWEREEKTPPPPPQKTGIPRAEKWEISAQSKEEIKRANIVSQSQARKLEKF